MLYVNLTNVLLVDQHREMKLCLISDRNEFVNTVRLKVMGQDAAVSTAEAQFFQRLDKSRICFSCGCPGKRFILL